MEDRLGYLNDLAVAERLGRALAREALAEEPDGATERWEARRRRKRRERLASVLQSIAARLTPADAEPSLERRPLPARH